MRHQHGLLVTIDTTPVQQVWRLDTQAALGAVRNTTIALQLLSICGGIWTQALRNMPWYGA
jgi:hypothetical protein